METKGSKRAEDKLLIPPKIIKQRDCNKIYILTGRANQTS